MRLLVIIRYFGGISITNKNGESFEIVEAIADGNTIKPVSIDTLSESPVTSIKIKNEKETLVNLSINSKDRNSFFTSLSGAGYFPADLRVKSINMKSPADLAGIKAGDVVFAINNISINSFMELKQSLNKTDETDYVVSVWSKGVSTNKKITPEVKKQGKQEVKLLGIYSDGSWLPPAFVQTESKGLIGSFISAFSRTWNAIEKTVQGFKKLITNEVSIKNIGAQFQLEKSQQIALILPYLTFSNHGLNLRKSRRD